MATKERKLNIRIEDADTHEEVVTTTVPANQIITVYDGLYTSMPECDRARIRKFIADLVSS